MFFFVTLGFLVLSAMESSDLDAYFHLLLLFFFYLVGVESIVGALRMVPLPQPTLPPHRPADACPGPHLRLYTLLLHLDL